MQRLRSDVGRLLIQLVAQVRRPAIAQQLLHSPYVARYGEHSIPGDTLERYEALRYSQRMTIAATPLSIYPLRIVLRGVSPLIWRRMLVHGATTLAHLHTLLQILCAWSDEHLHRFHIHGREYGSSGAPTCGVRLRDFCLHRGERFRYV
jgi:Plasmid pRiA4b ORF-3-like protein